MMGKKSGRLYISFRKFMDEDIFNPTDIVSHLVTSKENGTIIGINSYLLGTTMVRTGVEALIFDDELLILLKPYDVHGYMLPVTRLALHDIQSVRSFTSKFENPFVVRMNDDRNSLLA
jgi:hypothetical protein